jgi:hypothetical protein
MTRDHFFDFHPSIPDGENEAQRGAEPAKGLDFLTPKSYFYTKMCWVDYYIIITIVTAML